MTAENPDRNPEKAASTYAASGVDKEAGYESVRLMRDAVRATYSKYVLGDLGGFAATVELPEGYRKPVLVSGTDGVGTKLMVAQAMGIHGTVGIDLVAMCVNDILCAGASPLLFLDYIACGRNTPEKIASIVSGVAAGCLEAGCSLVGGETAEMPGMYAPEEYDLAGFALGIAEKDEIPSPAGVKATDVLIALPSSGVHSNGFSLIRKILFSDAGLSPMDRSPDLARSYGEELLVPTRIYAKAIAQIGPLRSSVHGMCHITGGGFFENIPRMLPDTLAANIEVASIPVPPIFGIIARLGHVQPVEMHSTFNMGAGFFMAVAAEAADAVFAALASAGAHPMLVGEVSVRDEGEPAVKLA